MAPVYLGSLCTACMAPVYLGSLCTASHFMMLSSVADRSTAASLADFRKPSTDLGFSPSFTLSALSMLVYVDWRVSMVFRSSASLLGGSVVVVVGMVVVF